MLAQMLAQMLEYLVVGLIVARAAVYAGFKYLPKRWRARRFNTKPGCGDGCASCKACGEPSVPAPAAKRIIKLREQPPR